MKILNHNISLLQFLYLVIYVILALVMILTPILITHSIHVRRTFIVDEDVMEMLLLSLLFGLTLVISKLYSQEASIQAELIEAFKKEKKKAEEKLFDSLDYIGKVNVQIEEMKSIFDATNAYPKTKNDFKKTVRFLIERVLGIVNTRWVLLRIMQSDTQRTIYESFEAREGFFCCYPQVSNKLIAEQHSVSPYTTVIFRPQNVNCIVFCAMPVAAVSNDQRVFMQAIMNEITMLFIILHSSFGKNENSIFPEYKSNGKTGTAISL